MFTFKFTMHRELMELRRALAAKDKEIQRLHRLLNDNTAGVNTDALTGASNRIALSNFLHDVKTRGYENSALSLIFLDLDHFKAVNDCFGHQMGDHVLQQFVDVLKDTASTADMIARIGGDEFVVVICEPIAVAYNLAQLIRAQLESIESWTGIGKHRITFSAGIAELQPSQSPEDLLAEADRSMYAAKSEGRNIIVTASDFAAGAEEDGEDLILSDLENRIRVVTDRLAQYLMIRSKRAVYHYKQEAMKDGLTGTFNRGYLDRLLDRELEKSRKQGRPITVAMVDLDDFGRINREYNWTGGDLAVKKAASVIQGQVRINDWVARYGGDEFFVVMPDTGRAEGERVAERIREALEETPVYVGRLELRVTASIGVTEYDLKSLDTRLLYGVVGEAARRAKNSGKNRVVSA